VWIGAANGLPLKWQSEDDRALEFNLSTLTDTFYDFDANIVIEPPIKRISLFRADDVQSYWTLQPTKRDTALPNQISATDVTWESFARHSKP
jgi:hypothetical protein